MRFQINLPTQIKCFLLKVFDPFQKQLQEREKTGERLGNLLSIPTLPRKRQYELNIRKRRKIEPSGTSSSEKKSCINKKLQQQKYQEDQSHYT
ncbi:hypothetical protein JTB14_000753 [Gonioctena quinquepunctata]|nr:hypothetical protein JTB14_000753 [Gonioctena quinquepunctata]